MAYNGVQDPYDFDPLATAQAAWKEVFHKNAYTNFSQINYLKDKAGLSWSHVLQNPQALSAVPREDIARDTSHANVLTWTRSGRCTSFAVAVVRRLEEWTPGVYDFKYYDLKGHRVARCTKTFILIDSSSMYGAIALPEDREWFTFEEQRPKWKWFNNTSKFEGTDRRLKKTSKELTEQECMTIDTCEIKDHKRGVQPLFFFRTFEQNEAEYYGMIKWNFSEHSLSIIRDMNSRNSTSKVAADSTFIFDGQGTDKTEAECRNMLERFIRLESGSLGAAQWEWNYGSKVNAEIWEAAKRLWGQPRLGALTPVYYIAYSPHWEEEDYAPKAKPEGYFGLLEQQALRASQSRSGS